MFAQSFDTIPVMSSAVVAAFEEAINSLDAVDLDALDDDTLHSLTVATQRLRDRFEVAAGRVLARWDTRGVWRNDQSLSAPARLSREVNSSLRSCRARLRQARRLGDVPGVVEAVGRGELSVEHVELLGRAQRVAPQDYASAEAMLVHQCSLLPFKQAEQVVAYWRLHVDPDGADADAVADEERAAAHVSETIDGTVVLDATLTGVGAETFHNELRRLCDQIRHADTRAGVVRTAAQRRAAALVEMATRSASTPANAQRPRPLFSVLVGEDTFRRAGDGDLGLEAAPIHRGAASGDPSPRPILPAPGRLRHTRRPVRRRSHRGVARQSAHRPVQRTPACPGHNRLPHLHDTDTEPLPPRDIGFNDQLRALIWWRQSHDPPPDEQAS